VLAMFNKGVRNISKALQSVLEEAESKRSVLGEDARLEAEQKALKMKNVSRQTLEEDAREGATVAMAKLTGYVISYYNQILLFISFGFIHASLTVSIVYHVACVCLVV
jgi:hypothetical protein